MTNLLHLPDRTIRIQAGSALIQLGFYSDAIVRVLIDSLAEMSGRQSTVLKSRKSTLAFKTLAQIVATNALRAKFSSNGKKTARVSLLSWRTTKLSPNA